MMKHQKFILLLGYTLLWIPSFAQHIQFEEVAAPISADFEAVMLSSQAFADIDGDGDQDLIIAGLSAAGGLTAKLYINKQGSFTPLLPHPFEGAIIQTVAFADVDSDNDPDLLLTTQGDTSWLSKLFVNDGNGNFTEVLGTPFTGVSQGDIVFEDFDGDTDLDVAIAGQAASGRIVELYTNDGLGNFTLDSLSFVRALSNSTLSFADVNGDLAPDLLLTGSGSSDLYLNNGRGNFFYSGTSFDELYPAIGAFADMDNDGDEDLLISGDQRGSGLGPVAKVYSNDGLGNFTATSASNIGGVHAGALDFADVEGDGDLDVLICGIGDSTACNLYFNDGSGNYSVNNEQVFEALYLGDIDFIDVDGDLDLDVLLSGGYGISSPYTKLYLNDGLGGFSEVSKDLFPGLEWSAVNLSDLDGDHDLDLLISGIGESESRPGAASLHTRMYINKGNGFFAKKTRSPFPGLHRGSISTADIDGDADLDVLMSGSSNFGGFAGRTLLYRNEGNGNFQEINGTPFIEVSQSSSAFADVDNDNDMDLLICGSLGEFNDFDNRCRLYKNDGNGNFQELGPNAFVGISQGDIAFADIDGDQDLDVMISGLRFSGSGPYATKLYLNDGNGIFSEQSGSPFAQVLESAIAFGDIDADMDQDVLITGWDGRDYIAKLYINDGMANFSLRARMPFEGVKLSALEFVDIDGNNTLDLLITGVNASGSVPQLYTNDGNGNFTEIPGMPFDSIYRGGISFGDIDGDSDTDLILSGQNGSDRITKLYRNISSTVSIDPVWESGIKLFQNYPNPSQSFTTISYNLQKSGQTRLLLLDKNGRVVADLLDEIQAPGDYQLRLNTSKLAPGLYLYRLSQNEYAISKKMWVLNR